MAETDMVQNLTEAVENATETITGKKVPSTPEGMLVAYGSLVIMAMLPIFFGSMRSVSHQKHQKATGQKAETMTTSDAMMFPIIAWPRPRK